jgi:hypothetical protein
MVELILALFISCGLALVSKRLMSAAVSEKKVNAALGGAIVTVLLFFMAAKWLGYKIALLAGVVVILVAAGIACWTLWNERQLTVEEDVEQVSLPAREEVVRQEDSFAEPDTLTVVVEEAEANQVESTVLLAETASALEEITEVGSSAEAQQEWSHVTLESKDPETFSSEKESLEELFRSLPSESTMEPSIETDGDSEEDLLLSDLSSLLEEVVPDAVPALIEQPLRYDEENKVIEQMLSPNVRRPVLEMDELFGEVGTEELPLPESRQHKPMALFELEEIEVGEDGTKKWADS